MSLKRMVITDGFGNEATIEDGAIKDWKPSIEGFKGIDEFTKEVRQAVLKTTPEGSEPDYEALGMTKKGRGAREKKSEKPSDKPARRSRGGRKASGKDGAGEDSGQGGDSSQ